jgi:trk system potassium uptake protein TrkH
MEERTSVLTYAVRGRVVLKYCGQLMLMLMLLTLVPAGLALFSGEWVPAQRYGIVCCGLLLVGAGLARLPAPSRIQSNEALTITALAFVLSPLLMSWPLMATGISLTDALFEAISGVTTTGLSVLGSIE